MRPGQQTVLSKKTCDHTAIEAEWTSPKISTRQPIIWIFWDPQWHTGVGLKHMTRGEFVMETEPKTEFMTDKIEITPRANGRKADAAARLRLAQTQASTQRCY